ncbi:hypothetical protein [Salinimicrobium sp. GXAS 041]|uniref:hypothetical protein n=1 Tax=Salinimicrobium sp. GXAS 041 TaxID=3400806 RepID=UPI003C794AC9
MTAYIKTVELSFVVLRFHEGFVVARIKNGVVLDHEKLDELLRTVQKFFNGKKHVYISERINDYNVDPLIYPQLVQEKTLSGIAIICKTAAAVKGANFEKKFSKVPFEVFMEFEDAREWALELLKK